MAEDKAADPEVLVSEDSIAMKIKRAWNPEDRMKRAMQPTRQKNPPQYGPSSQANDKENYD